MSAGAYDVRIRRRALDRVRVRRTRQLSASTRRRVPGINLPGVVDQWRRALVADGNEVLIIRRLLPDA